jgi:hypothetical protein
VNHDLPELLEADEGKAVFRQAEADYLEQNYDSFDEAGEVLLGDGKNLYRLTPTSDGEFVADCVGVLNPDRYERIMSEADEVFPDSDSFKVVADFIRSDEAYWNPEKREFLGEDDSFYDSSVADRTVQKALADGDGDYSDPAERDWSRISAELLD